MRKNSLSALTGARFFAALYVLMHHVFVTDSHLTGLMVNAWPWPLTNVFDRGCVAVDFFFVLSGFILAYNYSSGRGVMVCTKRDFWVARFARIWPMYVVGLLLALPLFFRASLYENADPVQVSANALFHLAGNLVFLNAWIPSLNDINGPGWSLSAEAFFYLVFPLALVPLGRLTNRLLFRAALCFYFLSLLPPILFSIWYPSTTNFYDLAGAQFTDRQMSNALYWFPAFRLPDFLIGVVLGLYFNRTPVESPKSVAANAGLALSIFVLALAFTIVVPWPILRNSFYTPLCAWLIWCLARQPESVIAKALAWSPMLLLGEASYGIYLFHLTIIRTLKIVLFHFGYELSLSSSVHLFVLTLALVIPLSIVLFWFVEEPSRKFLRKRLSSRPAAQPAQRPEFGGLAPVPVKTMDKS